MVRLRHRYDLNKFTLYLCKTHFIRLISPAPVRMIYRSGQFIQGFRSRLCRLRSNFFTSGCTIHLSLFSSTLRLHSAASELLKVHSGILARAALAYERRMIAITSARKVITNTFPAASRCAELQAELRTTLECIVLEELRLRDK